MQNRIRAGVFWQKQYGSLPWMASRNVCKERSIQVIGALLTTPRIEVGTIADEEGGRVYVFRPMHGTGETLWTPHADLIEAVCGVPEGQVKWPNEEI